MGDAASKACCSNNELDAAVERTGEPQPEVQTTAERLALNGFTVKQLLLFYKFYEENGLINKNTSTLEVVARVILPETAKAQSSYMESEFMTKHGGPQLATTLVSHSWSSDFQDTVVNILLDAIGSRSSLKSRCFDDARIPNFDCNKAMKELGDDALCKTYWLCIFAINQHRSFCGTSVKCDCGAAKPARGDSECEIDKLSEVVQWMERVVVSLDPKVEALSRTWVLREAWVATTGIPVMFSMYSKMYADKAFTLQAAENIVTPVEQSAASSREDKDAILAEIKQTQQGYAVFDEVLSCLVEMNLGQVNRLANLSHGAAKALRNLTQLEMRFHGFSDILTDLAILGFGQQHLVKLEGLHTLHMDLSRCRLMSSLVALCAELKELKGLLSLSLDFSHCESLHDFSKLESLKVLTELKECKLLFKDTLIRSLASLCRGLAPMKKMLSLTLDFTDCESLDDLEAMEFLGGLKDLSVCKLNFSGSGVREATGLEGLCDLQKLRTLDINFGSCVALYDVSALEKLAELPELHSCKLNFYCTNIGDRTSLEAALEGLKADGKLDLNFFSVARHSKMLAGWHDFQHCQRLSVRSAMGPVIEEEDGDSNAGTRSAGGRFMMATEGSG